MDAGQPQPAVDRRTRPAPPHRPWRARRDGAIRTLLRRSRTVLGADGLFLLAADPVARLLRPAASVGLSPSAVAHFEKRPLTFEESRLQKVLTSARPLRLHRPPPGCRLSRLGRTESQARTGVIMPVRTGRRVTGVLVALWRAHRRVSGGEMLAIRATGELLGPVLAVWSQASEAQSGPDRSGELRAFHRVSRLGTAALPPEELGRRALAEVCDALRFKRAELWLLGADQQKMRMFCTYGQQYSVPPRRVRPRDCPFTMMLLRRRQGLHHPDVCRDLSPPEMWLPWTPVTSVFGAPLRARNRLIGTLCADRGGTPFEMTANELLLGSVLANLLAEVIDGAIARETKEKRQRQMALIGRVGHLVSVEERPGVLARRVARLVRHLSRTWGVVLDTHDPSRRELEAVAVAGPDGRRLVGRRIPVGRARSLCPASRALRSRRPILVEDTAEVGPVPMHWPGIRCILVVPVRSKEMVLGTLRLEAMEPFAFDDDDIRVFAILGEQVGHAIRRARVLQALQSRQADLRAVSKDLEDLLEEDRRRIARELHDELAQSMTAAKINLGLLADLTARGPARVRRTLDETAALIDRTIGETRRISMDLRPAMLDELGLLPALRWYTNTFSRRTGVKVALRAHGAESRIATRLETLLFRFVQEALTNVARHARAHRVQVSLVQDNGLLRATVSDDGVGMAARKSRRGGLGLLGMRERIERARGRLRIVSRPGHGTRLMAEIPREPAAARARPEAADHSRAVS
jgi:signal transduction histidine kinase